MRKFIILAACVAAVVVPTAASANSAARHRASPPSLTTELMSYLAQTRAPVTTVYSNMKSVNQSFRANTRGVAGKAASAWLAQSVLLGKVKAPVVLRGSHADLVRGTRILSNTLRRYLAEGGEGADIDKSLAALHHLEAPFFNSTSLIVNWGEEFRAQLRRAGLAIPLWLKKIA
jgi:hypothetical protein